MRRRRRRRRRQRLGGRRKEPDDLLEPPAAGRLLERRRRRSTTARKLALKQRGGKIGDFTITYKPLDDSLASTGSADEGKEAQNARTAVRDKTHDRPARRVQLRHDEGLAADHEQGRHPAGQPRQHVRRPDDRRSGLREGRARQVLPGRHAHVRPRRPAGHDPGRRDGHDDEGRRLQGPSSTTTPRRPTAPASAATSSSRPRSRGSKLLGDKGVDIKAPNYRSLTSSVKADCVSTTMEIENNGVQLVKDAAAALPNAKLYGGDAMALNDTADPKKGLPANVGARFKATIATLDPEQLPARGQEVLRGLQQGVLGRAAGPVRDLRLRGDGPDPRLDRGRR